HDGVQPVMRQHETTDMLGKMTWKSHDLIGEAHRLHDRRILRVEHALTDLAFLHRMTPAAPHAVRHRRRDVLAEAEDLADFADGAAWAIADDGGGQRRLAVAITQRHPRS